MVNQRNHASTRPLVRVEKYKCEASSLAEPLTQAQFSAVYHQGLSQLAEGIVQHQHNGFLSSFTTIERGNVQENVLASEFNIITCKPKIRTMQAICSIDQAVDALLKKHKYYFSAYMPYTHHVVPLSNYYLKHADGDANGENMDLYMREYFSDRYFGVFDGKLIRQQCGFNLVKYNDQVTSTNSQYINDWIKKNVCPQLPSGAYLPVPSFKGVHYCPYCMISIDDDFGHIAVCQTESIVPGTDYTDLFYTGLAIQGDVLVKVDIRNSKEACYVNVVSSYNRFYQLLTSKYQSLNQLYRAVSFETENVQLHVEIRNGKMHLPCYVCDRTTNRFPFCSVITASDDYVERCILCGEHGGKKLPMVLNQVHLQYFEELYKKNRNPNLTMIALMKIDAVSPVAIQMPIDVVIQDAKMDLDTARRLISGQLQVFVRLNEGRKGPVLTLKETCIWQKAIYLNRYFQRYIGDYRFISPAVVARVIRSYLDGKGLNPIGLLPARTKDRSKKKKKKTSVSTPNYQISKLASKLFRKNTFVSTMERILSNIPLKWKWCSGIPGQSVPSNWPARCEK